MTESYLNCDYYKITTIMLPLLSLLKLGLVTLLPGSQKVFLLTNVDFLTPCMRSHINRDLFSSFSASLGFNSLHFPPN